MSKSVELVPFHQHEILTVREGAEVLVPLKPLVESIGLKWHGQFERVQRHPVLSKGIRVTRIPSQGGMQESTCLTLDMVPGFLTTIQSERIKEPEIRQAVVLFQTEAFRVLFQHFFGGRTAGGAPAISGSNEVLALIRALKGESNPAAQRLIHAMLQQACDARQIPVPPVHELAGHDAELWRETLERFETVMMMLAGLDIDPNLHRKPHQLLAINLPAFMELCRQNKIETPSAHALRTMFPRHPQFNGHGAVNCRDGRVRHCWTFTRTPDHASA